jgi:hypothetical protein
MRTSPSRFSAMEILACPDCDPLQRTPGEPANVLPEMAWCISLHGRIAWLAYSGIRFGLLISLESSRQTQAGSL